MYKKEGDILNSKMKIFVLVAVALAFCMSLAYGQDFSLIKNETKSTDAEIHALRVQKCMRIIKTFYNYKGKTNFSPYVEYFISYHEQLEKNGGKDAKGFSEAWWWSLVYGGANFSMSCYSTAPGNCAGPLDVKHYPLVLDPKANIRHHCQEMFSYYKNNNARGIELCKYVMLPASPRDWGGGMFRKTNQKHMNCIAKGYKFGNLR